MVEMMMFNRLSWSPQVDDLFEQAINDNAGRQQQFTGWLERFILNLCCLLGVAACSPTDPCINGRDGIGRGPIQILTASCTPTGSDVQCSATAREAGYCATSILKDITSITDWISSAPAVATFTTPGLLKVLAPGEVSITARQRFETFGGDYDYTVAPGTSPERMSHLAVIVSDTADKLPGANITVFPDRGPSQTGVSNSSGVAQFWVFPTAVRVAVSLNGYATLEAGTSPPNPASWTQSIIVKLSAL